MEFTDKQLEIIRKSRELMPETFSINTTDEKILAFASVVLSDINVFPPLSGYTTETVPDILLPILYFGVSMFAALFLQMNASLQDFNYNDNGLTVQVDQVGKINASYQNILSIYKEMIVKYKKTQIFAVGGKGLGTPRFQSQIGQFLKIALGCFVPDTRVLTHKGFKNICDVCIGDYVLSLDGNYHRVYDIVTRRVQENIIVLHVGNSVIKCTANHEFFVSDKGWIRADKLTTKDKVIVGESRRTKRITKLKKEFYSGLTYDLSIEDSHSYNVEGIIVHNSAFTWNS